MPAPSPVEVTVWCAGAWRLGRFDATGLAAFANSTDAAWRSFFAAILVAPLWVLVSLLQFAVSTDGASDVSLGRYATVEAISYVIGWTAFPVIMAGVCDSIGRRDAYLRFVAAYNWSMLIQNVVYLPVVLAGQAGLIPGEGALFLMVVTLLWALAFEAFVIKESLQIPMAWAIALTVGDLILAFLIGATADVVL